MNYNRIYQSLVVNAKSRTNSNGLFEIHHIVPRCLGGSNDTENLVKLSLREHYFAHVLLYKIHKGNRRNAGKLIAALNLMSNTKRYKISSRLYAMMRSEFLLNHPCKTLEISSRIRESLRSFRMMNGYYEILCACGCNEICNISQNPNLIKFIKHHRPKRYCLCGCGNIVNNSTTQLRIPGHENVKIKCACGCGEDTYKSFNRKTPDAKLFKNGHDSDKIKNGQSSLISTLHSLSTYDKWKRMKNSCGRCNHKLRGSAIAKGKASHLKLLTNYGQHITEFWTYENVTEITGYSYSQIQYRIKRYNGFLLNGNIVQYISKYGDKNE